MFTRKTATQARPVRGSARAGTGRRVRWAGTPALRSRVESSADGRQRGVIELVVAGLSNREIAERLVMSVRTVEGHVYRACQRVGAKSREELASILSAGRGGR